MNWAEAVSALLDGRSIRLPGWTTALRLTDSGICVCGGRDERPLNRHSLDGFGAFGRLNWEIADD